ncbi:MAG: 1,4-alpha-glucan branching enzyme [Verrucomicrobiales bacterium]|nr:1,4-alpha-glucan branching enzyme [Verrucomicrobiales bacterium]|tara:strand:+ start:25671 stop:27878 length:2208 start_codon:yes stop_codon:yes gene_type:complete
MPSEPSTYTTDPNEISQILDARHSDPFGFLGLHKNPAGTGHVLRVFRPGTVKVTVVPENGDEVEMTSLDQAGLYEYLFENKPQKFSYQLRYQFGEDLSDPQFDVYSFGPVLGEQDLHFFAEGNHRYLWDCLGAQLCEQKGVAGVSFAVWAPNAFRVSVVGDFNAWDGRVHPMRNHNGVWEIFIPHIGGGEHYKYEIVGASGNLCSKSDPFAFFSQHGNQTASITFDRSQYKWSDSEWMGKRAETDLYHSPISVYEAHLGSWKRRVDEENRFLTYSEFADELIGYVLEMGYTHIELMPVAEFPFDGSWGYQVCGFFAPTSRFGNPDDFRAFVDRCHQKGIGVIVDWVPAHFPKDDHGLGCFDGTALYEHADPRQGEHTDWGTLIFNYGRNEVRNFLISNAMYWLKEFHIDGLRVDAVASMLYLDYSRKEGQWVPNRFGGRENIEAIEFLRELNKACYDENPGIMTIAEESTAFPGVSRPVDSGGLGFGFKWNMGWMNDSLSYMSHEPIHRKYHHGMATFSMIYAYHENYVLVLSHDEVVHGKGSVVQKMPGDRWQQMANLRFFFAWMFAHPGKKLLFQGLDFGQSGEWDYAQSLPWDLLEYAEHKGIQQLVKDLNRLYTSEPALHELDHAPEGFEWIDHDDAKHSLFSFIRRDRSSEAIVVVVNATPVPRIGYRLGVPEGGFYEEIFNSDSQVYGGSDIGSGGGIPATEHPAHDRAQSIQVDIPPLGTVLFKRREV